MDLKWKPLDLHGWKSPVTNTANYKGWTITHYTDVDDYMAHIPEEGRVLRAKTEKEIVAQVEGATVT